MASREFVLQYVTVKVKTAKGKIKSFKFGVSSPEDVVRQLHDALPSLVDVGPITDQKGGTVRVRKDIKHGATLFANTSIFKSTKGKASAPPLPPAASAGTEMNAYENDVFACVRTRMHFFLTCIYCFTFVFAMYSVYICHSLFRFFENLLNFHADKNRPNFCVYPCANNIF